MRKISGLFLVLLLGVLLVSCSDSKLLDSTDGPYTVTFNTLGGTEVDEITVLEHDFFLPSSIPTKDGYVFAGWYLDENYYYPMSFNAGTASDLTLYAKWIDEDTLSDDYIESIVSAILLENGYDMTRDELIEAIQSIINPNILSASDVSAIVNSVIDEGGLIDETLLIERIRLEINFMEEFESHVTALLSDVSQSVIMIDTYDGATLVSGGSGVIYKRDGNRYYALTNDHVVYDSSNSNYYSDNELAVTIFHSDGNKYISRTSNNITLHGSSVTHDLAIISFTSLDDLRVIDLGSYNNLKVGQLVFAIGSPLDLPNTSSMGIISQFDRDQNDGYGMDTTTIQHTASINPGNSGGALINIYGELIGINNMSYVDMEVGEGIEGLHFAIQINILLQMIPILENQ